MQQSLTVAYGHWLFKHRNWVFPVVSFALLFGLPPATGPVGPIPGIAVDILGIAVVLAGALLRTAVVGLAYIKRGGVNKKVYAANLVTSGLFSHCRNPLYVGNLLISAGLFIAHGNPVSMLLAAGYFGYSYHAITMAEEGFLRLKFGAAYERYCAHVNRWLFRLDGLGQTFASMHFNWRRVIANEYMTTFTWNITLLSIFGYESAINNHWLKALPVLVCYLAFLLVALISIKHLKKRGVFKEAGTVTPV